MPTPHRQIGRGPEGRSPARASWPSSGYRLPRHPHRTAAGSRPAAGREAPGSRPRPHGGEVASTAVAYSRPRPGLSPRPRRRCGGRTPRRRTARQRPARQSAPPPAHRAAPRRALGGGRPADPLSQGEQGGIDSRPGRRRGPRRRSARRCPGSGRCPYRRILPLLRQLSCRPSMRVGVGAMARPSGSGSPPSSNNATPLQSRLQPCS